MKKIAVALFAVLVVLPLVACGPPPKSYKWGMDADESAYREFVREVKTEPGGPSFLPIGAPGLFSTQSDYDAMARSQKIEVVEESFKDSVALLLADSREEFFEAEGKEAIDAYEALENRINGIKRQYEALLDDHMAWMVFNAGVGDFLREARWEYSRHYQRERSAWDEAELKRRGLVSQSEYLRELERGERLSRDAKNFLRSLDEANGLMNPE